MVTAQLPGSGVADRVRDAIDHAAISRRVIADRVGIAPATLSRKLQGHRRFNGEELALLAHELDVMPSQLIGDSQAVI